MLVFIQNSAGTQTGVYLITEVDAAGVASAVLSSNEVQLLGVFTGPIGPGIGGSFNNLQFI